MAKISVVLLADVETHGDLGRVANALSLVKGAKAAGVRYLSEFEGHPSLRNRIAEGYQVITF